MKRFALLCAGALATLSGCADSVSRGVGPEAGDPSLSGSTGGGYTWTVKKELLEVHALEGTQMPLVLPPYVIPTGATLWFKYRITYTKTSGGSQGETAQITDDGVAACASVGIGFSCTSYDTDLGENGGNITSKTWTVSNSGTRNIVIDVKNENAVCPHSRTLTNTVSLVSNGIASTPSSASTTVFTATTPPAGCTPPPPPPLVAGCTPGYWKQSHHFDSWPMGYTPNRLIGTVFSGTTAAPYNLGGTTMVNALQGDGGPTIVDAARILLRAATAAVLNSASTSFSYPLTTAQIVAQVNGALATQNRATILNLATTLDRYNNARCPLN